jgi:hypothetical protein
MREPMVSRGPCVASNGTLSHVGLVRVTRWEFCLMDRLLKCLTKSNEKLSGSESWQSLERVLFAADE